MEDPFHPPDENLAGTGVVVYDRKVLLGRWLRFLAGGGIFVGPVVTVGTYLLDGWHLLHLGLPPQALEGLGATIFFLSVGGLLYRWRLQSAIPVFRPSVRPTVSTPQQEQPIEGDDLSALIERWSNDHFPGSAVARDTQAWSVVHKAKEDLKPLLRRALFSRFLGTVVNVTDGVMTDRARYPSNPHPISYGAVLARDVDLLRIFVEFSWETQHGQWTQRSRLFLAEFQNQTRGGTKGAKMGRCAARRTATVEAFPATDVLPRKISYQGRR